MVNRRDMFLGLAVLVVILGIILISFLTLSTLVFNGIPITSKRVAIIEINGAIISPMPIVQRLERYIKDENIPAIILRLNTPGGGISATQEIYETVIKARSAGKKIVASMGSVAASGGYYIAAACDTIIATPGSITGSIGVIANFTEFSDLFEKIGITFNVRKSGKYKDVGSFSRKMTEEEKTLIDNVIMDTYEQFIDAVSEGRNLNPDYVRQYADGRVFTGRQAKEIGFVDVLGTYHDAIDIAGEMAGLGPDPPVHKEPKGIFWDMFVESTVNIVSRILEVRIPKLSYLLTY